MATPYFTDRSNPPTEKEILRVLGPVAGAWTKLFDRIRAEHPDLSEAWRYYTDGNSWLLKLSHKSKTVFWLTVEQGAFRVGFYFPERLCGALLTSDLTEERKVEIGASTPTGKLRAVSVVFGPPRGVRDVMTLITLKKTLR